MRDDMKRNLTWFLRDMAWKTFMGVAFSRWNVLTVCWCDFAKVFGCEDE